MPSNRPFYLETMPVTSYIKGIKEKTSQKSDPAVSKDFFYSTYEEVTQPHLDCMQAHTGARYIPGSL